MVQKVVDPLVDHVDPRLGVALQRRSDVDHSPLAGVALSVFVFQA